MKHSLVVLALVGSGCGKIPSHGETSTPKNSYFVPASIVEQLPADFKIIESHDSGFLVEVPAGEERKLDDLTTESFSIKDWKAERTKYTFSTMEKKVQELAKQYPRYANLDTYATSKGGRPQYVLTLTDSKSKKQKKELMITAATHGNEIATVDAILGVTELLLKGQGSDRRLTKMLSDHTVHIVPAVCVDSYVAQTRHVDGVDPNRDYPYPEKPTRKPVKCIADIMNFFNARDIVGTLDIHSAASMVFFPWAYTYDQIPQADYDKLDDLTTKMSEKNGFAHGQISSTIYVAKGSSSDYYYWKGHAAATALELSHNLAANAKSADDLVEEITESTWTFIEEGTW